MSVGPTYSHPLLSTQEQGERWRSTLGAPRIISTSFRLLSLAERKIRCKWLWIRTIRSCKIEESWSHDLKCYHKCYNSRGVPKSETHFILEFLWDAYLPSLSNPLDLSSNAESENSSIAFDSCWKVSINR